MEVGRDLGKERERLSGLIDKFAAGGAEGCKKNPHIPLGTCPGGVGNIKCTKHLDHHLRQFGAPGRSNSSLAESGCWPPGYFDSKCPATFLFAGPCGAPLRRGNVVVASA